mgnify:FL=1
MSKDWWDDLPNHPANQKERREWPYDEASKFTSEDVKDVTNVVIEGVELKDHPDYCDAFVASADWFGEELDDEALDIVNEDSDFVYEHVLELLIGLADNLKDQRDD